MDGSMSYCQKAYGFKRSNATGDDADQKNGLALLSLESMTRDGSCGGVLECHCLYTVEVRSVSVAVPGLAVGDRISFCTPCGGGTGVPSTLSPSTLLIGESNRATVPMGSSECRAMTVPEGTTTTWFFGFWYIGEAGLDDASTASFYDPLLNDDVDPVALTWDEFQEVWSGLSDLPEVLLQGDPPNDVFESWRGECESRLEAVAGIPPSTCE